MVKHSIRRTLIALACALATTATTLAAAPAATSTTASTGVTPAVTTAVQLDALSQAIVNETNKIRAAHGLKKVTVNTKATQGSAQWAGFLASQNLRADMYHDPQLFTTTATSAATRAGENILYTSGSADAARFLSLWMNSPGHRANILRPEWTHIGVAWDRNSDGTYLYAVQRFVAYPSSATTRTATPQKTRIAGYNTSKKTITVGQAAPKDVVAVSARNGKISLQRKTNGTWKTVRTVAVKTSNGKAAILYPTHKTAGTYTYRIRYGGSSTHKAAVSATKKVVVRKKTQKIAGYNTSTRSTVKGRVAAPRDVVAISTKRTVALQLKKGGTWKTVKRFTPNSRTGKVGVTYPKVTRTGTYTYRLKVGSTKTYNAVTTRAKTVRVR